VVDPATFVPSPIKNLTFYAALTKCSSIGICRKSPGSPASGFTAKKWGEDYQLIGETQIPVFVDKEPSLTRNDYRVHAAGPAKEGPGADLSGVKYIAPARIDLPFANSDKLH